MSVIIILLVSDTVGDTVGDVNGDIVSFNQ